MLSIIVIVTRNGVIGFQNKMPWHLPADLKYFKALTLGHTLIMGRKTAESLLKPLPGRKNIVISRFQPQLAEGFILVKSLSEALELLNPEDENFIIGGGQIFTEAFNNNCIDKIYLTRIDAELEGDVFFPELDSNQWKEISRKCQEPDERNQYGLCFIVYSNSK